MDGAHLTPDECLASARETLLTAKQLLVNEIKTYPPPIAGCDAQFNHLLEQRSKVSLALSALENTQLGATSNMQLNR